MDFAVPVRLVQCVHEPFRDTQESDDKDELQTPSALQVLCYLF